MLYMTGPRDSLALLYMQEGYQGSFEEYRKKFAELNPVLVKTLPKDFQMLPPYMPVQLVTNPGEDPIHTMEVATIVSGYSPRERQTLRQMQDENHDIPTSVTALDVMEDFHAFLDQSKKKLTSPIIPTPFYVFDRSLTNKSLIKLTGEGLKHTAYLKETSTAYVGKNKLFELMKRRDELNHEWLQLKGKKGVDGARKAIEKQTKELTAQIKKLIPRSINASAQKHLHGYKTQDAKRLASNAASLKVAKKGAEKLKATHLDRLNITGLAKHRTMIKGFKMIGNGVKKAATYTNYGLAAYSIADTYAKGGNVAKVAFREGTSLYAGALLSSAVAGGLADLGGIAIGAVAGDMALGATILACCPVVGWVVLAVAGATVAGFVSYQTKDVAERVWDGVESGYVKEKLLQFGRWIYDDFKLLGEHIMKSD